MRFNQPETTEGNASEPKPENNNEQIKDDRKKPKFKFKFSKKWLIGVSLGVAMVVLAVLAIMFYLKAQNLEEKNVSAIQNETQKVIEEVSKLIVLPEGEEPTVATVSEVEKLREQPFFRNAQNGYKVLIYSGAGKAVLYDPVAKKIVEVAPLNMKQN